MTTMNSEVLELLPQEYEYTILKVDPLQTTSVKDGLSILLRVKIFTKENALKWIGHFQETSHITLRVLQTFKENTSKIIFKKEYRCVHNTRPKKGSAAHPKHTNCTAKLAITLKNFDMKRSKDIQLKDFPCEIYIRHTHNHAVLKYRPPSKELEKVFKELFEKGHSPSSSLSIFKDNLFEEYGAKKYHEIVADGQKCPTQKWVYDFYHSIFKKEYGEPSGLEMVASQDKFVDEYNKKCGDNFAVVEKNEDTHQIIGLTSEENGDDISGMKTQIKICTDADGIRLQLNKIVEDLMTRYENQLDQYEKPVKEFIKCFNTNCKTESSLISALNTFGKYSRAALPLLKRGKNTQGGNTIGVQPTVLSRRKTKMGERKALQSGRPPKLLRLTDHSNSTVDYRVLGIFEKNRKIAVPHSLQFCVDKNISLGQGHSKR